MSTDITTTNPEAPVLPSPEPPDQDALIVAFSPSEMEAAQVRLAQWFDFKLAELRKELSETKANYDQAVKAKWRSSLFLALMKRLEERAKFYEKALDAVRAGYLMIPSLAMDTFAIRTARKKPLPGTSDNAWDRHELAGHPSLSAGEGRYVSNMPTVYERNVPNGMDAQGKQKFTKQTWAESYNALEFPMELARPAIMGAAQRAMALKVFDEMGIVVDQRKMRKGDPIIVGRILNPRRNRPDLSFFICWALDPTVI